MDECWDFGEGWREEENEVKSGWYLFTVLESFLLVFY